MNRSIVYIFLFFSGMMSSCIFPYFWDEFKTEHIVSDFYLTSMNDDLHTLVLQEDENYNSGIIIISNNILKIGHNERFIIASNCPYPEENNQDTTYFIIDLERYNNVAWYKKIFDSHSDKIIEYQFDNENEFNQAVSRLNGDSKIEWKAVREDS